jgi:hypothetical protein
VIWIIGAEIGGLLLVCITVVVVYRIRLNIARLRRLTAESARLAAEQERAAAQEARLALLPEPDFTRQPSWVVVAWHGEDDNVVLASADVAAAHFNQERWVERQGPYRLTQRRCGLELEFPRFTLLQGAEDFDAVIAELRTVWRVPSSQSSS